MLAARLSDSIDETTVETTVESTVELDGNSRATERDLAIARAGGYCVDPYATRPGPDLYEYEYEATEEDDDRVTARTLQDDNRPRGHGGAKNAKSRAQRRPISPQEIMDKRVRAINYNAPEAFLHETDNQRAERLLREAQKRIERNERGGRPRIGAEARQMYGVRLEPSLLTKIQTSTGLELRDFIEAQAALLPPQEEAVAA
jgi:hypothetical protein